MLKSEAQKMVDDAKTALDNVRSELLAVAVDRWRFLGGCERCKGTSQTTRSEYFMDEGWRDVWVRCPEEACTATTVGPMPTTDLVYRRDGVPPLPYPDIVQTPDDGRRLSDAEENLCIAQDILAGVERVLALIPGCRVKVIKGRKIKVGSTGVVRWVGEAEQVKVRGDRFKSWRDAHYETEQRVGVLVDGGDDRLVYTNANNLEVTDASPERQAATDLDLPSLYGSEKQRRWAEKIRHDAIKAGRMTVDVARKHTDSRYFIDNRNTLAA